jgi:hypothetical protein
MILIKPVTLELFNTNSMIRAFNQWCLYANSMIFEQIILMINNIIRYVNLSLEYQKVLQNNSDIKSPSNENKSDF